MNAIALNAKNFESAREWVPGIRHAIIALLSDVDYLVANIRHDFDVLNSDGGGGHVFRQNVGSDGTLTNESKSSGDLVKPEEGIIQAGKNQGFPFDKYHFPPTAFNYFLDPGTRSISDASDDSYIGTFLLFSLKENPPISQANIDLVERLRPFFVFLITDFIVRSNSNKGAGSEYELMLGRVAGNAGLTPREQRVLSLAFLGHSYQEIADLIFVSLNTVKSHIRSVYKKTGVKKLGEIYLKYLTSIDLDRSELDSEDYND